jgi:hypothetical protein
MDRRIAIRRLGIFLLTTASLANAQQPKNAQHVAEKLKGANDGNND